MGYYVRAFCLHEEIPNLGQVFQWVEEKGIKLSISGTNNNVDLTSTNWSNVDLLYKLDKLPILVECNQGEIGNDGLMENEIDEFIERIGKPGLSNSKRKVVNHLKSTKFIIACQLPTSDIDDDGYKANSTFLNYFVTHCSAMIQADGEGFYKNDRLVVKLG